jgi:hypothetical protein
MPQGTYVRLIFLGKRPLRQHVLVPEARHLHITWKRKAATTAASLSQPRTADQAAFVPEPPLPLLPSCLPWPSSDAALLLSLIWPRPPVCTRMRWDRS